MTVLYADSSHTDARWKVRGDELAQDVSLREKLLLLRGIEPGRAREEFLHPNPHRSLPQLLGDPLSLPDAQVAAERINRALVAGEKICVYGDYDADGVTATAILVRGLRALGGNVCYYVPHRVDEGFGLNVDALRAIAERGATLVITCDCGTSDVAEVAEARGLGMDVVISDHHAPPGVLPEAVAVVNPRRSEGSYPFRRLTGAGVAYVLLRAVAYASDRSQMVNAGELLQLAAIGTVADVAPVLGENRSIVRAGLTMMNTRPLPGLRALIASSGILRSAVTESDLAFRIAPRLNAAGRMQHADLACELLIESGVQRARKITSKLENLNNSRRQITGEMIEQAQAMLDPEDLSHGRVLLVYSQTWSPALLGIVAGRLSHLYDVPVIAATLYGESVRASVRSVDSLDVIQVLNDCAQLMVEHGGHALAAGFTAPVGSLSRIRDCLNEAFSGADRNLLPEVDLELEPQDLGPELVRALTELAPFGAGNEEPLFGFRGVPIGRVQTFGRNGNDHVRFSIPGYGGKECEVVGFGMSDRMPQLLNSAKIDIVARPLRQRNGSFSPLRFCADEIFIP